MNDPVVESVTAAAYTVPTDAPEADGTLTWDSVTLVLAQVEAEVRFALGSGKRGTNFLIDRLVASVIG